MARKNFGRPVTGILLLDKPVGITSNGALQQVKKIFRARKAGHTGSLDPVAGGLLPLCFGDATKVSAYLLDADKSYRAVVKLGITTTTGDTEGEVVSERPLGRLQEKMVRDVLLSFTGEIEQIPPMHSAIKRQGVPLYQLARKGIVVEREPRLIKVHALDLLRLQGDELEISVSCSKGTYIRSLAEDIGEVLGCGGHIVSLTRLETGPFSMDKAVSMEKLEELGAARDLDALDQLLLPMETALAHWPDIHLTDDAAFYLRRGQPVFVPKVGTDGLVRLSTDEGFLGVGQVLDDGRVAPKRILAV